MRPSTLPPGLPTEAGRWPALLLLAALLAVLAPRPASALQWLVLSDGQEIQVRDFGEIPTDFHLYTLPGGTVLGLWPDEVDQAATLQRNRTTHGPVAKANSLPPPTTQSPEPRPPGPREAVSLPVRPMNFSFRDAPLREVILLMAELADLNVVLHPQVTGTVTVELHQVPWRTALESFLRPASLTAELEGNVLYVAPVEALARQAREDLELRRIREARR